MVDGLQVHRWFLHVEPMLRAREEELRARWAAESPGFLPPMNALRARLGRALLHQTAAAGRARDEVLVSMLRRPPARRVLFASHDRRLGSSLALKASWLARGRSDTPSRFVDTAFRHLATAGLEPITRLNIGVAVLTDDPVEDARTLPGTVAVAPAATPLDLGSELAAAAFGQLCDLFLASSSRAEQLVGSPAAKIARDAAAIGGRFRYFEALARTEEPGATRQLELVTFEVGRIANSAFPALDALGSLMVEDLVTTSLPGDRRFEKFLDGGGAGQS